METDDIRGADGHKWPQTIDAQAWVTAWMRLTEGQSEMARDHATMIGWFANSLMAGFDEALRRMHQAEQMCVNPTEALYGFIAWLTTRSEPVTLGAHHECGPVVELLREFCQRHELPECRERYASLLRWDDDT